MPPPEPAPKAMSVRRLTPPEWSVRAPTKIQSNPHSQRCVQAASKRGNADQRQLASNAAGDRILGQGSSMTALSLCLNETRCQALFGRNMSVPGLSRRGGEPPAGRLQPFSMAHFKGYGWIDLRTPNDARWDRPSSSTRGSPGASAPVWNLRQSDVRTPAQRGRPRIWCYQNDADQAHGRPASKRQDAKTVDVYHGR